MMHIATRSILLAIGFEPEAEDKLIWRSDGLTLVALECVDDQFARVMRLTGYARTPRTAQEIDYSLPLQVASLEAGVALIAHGCQGVRPITSIPWLNLGRQWKGHLPWARQPA